MAVCTQRAKVVGILCCFLIFFLPSIILFSIGYTRKANYKNHEQRNDIRYRLQESQIARCAFQEISDCVTYEGTNQQQYIGYSHSDKCGEDKPMSWWGEGCSSDSKPLNEPMTCYIEDCSSGEIQFTPFDVIRMETPSGERCITWGFYCLIPAGYGLCHCVVFATWSCLDCVYFLINPFGVLDHVLSYDLLLLFVI